MQILVRWRVGSWMANDFSDFHHRFRFLVLIHSVLIVSLDVSIQKRWCWSVRNVRKSINSIREKIFNRVAFVTLFSLRWSHNSRRNKVDYRECFLDLHHRCPSCHRLVKRPARISIPIVLLRWFSINHVHRPSYLNQRHDRSSLNVKRVINVEN